MMQKARKLNWDLVLVLSLLLIFWVQVGTYLADSYK
jgi:hypothetical protein